MTDRIIPMLELVGGPCGDMAIDLEGNITSEFVSFPGYTAEGLQLAEYRIVDRDRASGWPTRAEFVKSTMYGTVWDRLGGTR